jgi:CBS domain-containing protein
MKSLERLPISSVLFEAARKRKWSWFDDDDEPTAELWVLGSLVEGPALVVDETEPLATAQSMLVEQRVPALAVVDAARTLRGVITRTDVLRVLATRTDAIVGDAMSGVVFAMPLEASIESAAALMAYEGVGQVVVTGTEGELVGMVSALDIARHFAVRAGYLAA